MKVDKIDENGLKWMNVDENISSATYISNVIFLPYNSEYNLNSI